MWLLPFQTHPMYKWALEQKNEIQTLDQNRLGVKSKSKSRCKIISRTLNKQISKESDETKDKLKNFRFGQIRLKAESKNGSIAKSIFALFYFILFYAIRFIQIMICGEIRFFQKGWNTFLKWDDTAAKKRIIPKYETPLPKLPKYKFSHSLFAD